MEQDNTIDAGKSISEYNTTLNGFPGTTQYIPHSWIKEIKILSPLSIHEGRLLGIHVVKQRTSEQATYILVDGAIMTTNAAGIIGNFRLISAF